MSTTQQQSSGFRDTKTFQTKQKQKQQFKQTSSKILSYRTVSSSIQQLLESNSQSKNFSTIQQVRVMHSEQLQSLKGIQVFKSSLVTVNLSSNVISSIQGIEQLALLETLEIRNNRIQSLKGINKCTNLVKIDASNNQLTSFQGLRDIKETNRLEKVILTGNFFEDLSELYWVQKCKKLQQIVFLKGKSSNPFCQKYGDYIFVLSEYIQNPSILIDDQRLSDHMNNLELSNNYSNMNIRQDNSNNHAIDQNISRQRMQRKRSPNMMTQPLLKPSQIQNGHSASPFQRTPSQTNAQLFFTQQQQHLYQQTEEMFQFKNQQIEELKYKNSQLEIQQSTQYKQLLKKQTEVDRLQGQNKELHKQLEKKQKALGEMHKRIEDLLKSSTERNKVIELKSSEIDSLKQEINELKIQGAQHKALSKDYERRLSQLHEKTLFTIEERTLKQDEIKRKYEEVYEENYKLCKEKEEMKDRLRQLTQLLREWEFKYEGKVNQLEARHAHQRQELLREAEEKISTTTEHYQHEMHKMDEQMRSRVQEIQHTYKSSLQEAFQKHKKLKTAYQQRTKNEQQMKIFLKSALQKNQEQQMLIQEFQDIVIKIKGQLSSTYEEKQLMHRQLNQIKYRQAQQLSNAEQKISRLSYERNKLQKELMDLKQTHSALLSQSQGHNKYQKMYEQLQGKYEDLQNDFSIKNQLLEDKNDTIQGLKQDIEALQRQGSQKVDQKEFESLRKKYEKYKKENQQFKQETTSLIQENDQLRKENDDCKEIIVEFETMKDTFAKYEKIVAEKDSELQQLTKYIEECKNITMSCQQEVQQWKRQYSRLETQSMKRERELRQEIRDIDYRHKRELDNIKIEKENYRKNTLQELQSVYLKLQK